MNIATAKYTTDELLKILRSNSRNVYYEYTIANTQGETIGKIDIEDGVISFDSSLEVMRTFSGTCMRTDLLSINSLDYKLVPWMCLRIGSDVVKWALGKFIIEPSVYDNMNSEEVHITGFDLGKIALDDKVDSRVYVPSGSVYTSFALQLAGTDYTDIELDASPKARNSEAEWDIGESKLKIINDLLKAISYNSLYFDSYGTGHITEYVMPENQSIERTYKSGSESIIVDGISKTSNKFEIPNKFIRYVENADSDYMISTYTNNDPASPYSVINRGRTIVDSQKVQDIATQGDLDALTRIEAIKAMAVTETIVFSTLNMPGHEFRNCLFIDIPEYGISEKYIEVAWEMQLSPNGKMIHTCEKVVTL